MALLSSLRKLSVALVAVVALAGFGRPGSAELLGASHLAGWWIALDNVGFPPLWADGTIVPMEELLIIDRDGRFEDRMMGFYSVNAQSCADMKICSDAPLVATGRIAVAGRGRLVISEVRQTSNRIDSARSDPIIHARAVSATTTWMVEGRADPDDGILLLRKAVGEQPRMFIKVPAEKLRRLRAGLMTASLSARQHWRCYLAAATGGDAQRLPLRNDKPMKSEIRDYIAAASYSMTAFTYAGRPTPDDPAPAQRQLAGVAVEHLMTEPFAKLPPPSTVQARRDVAALARYLTLLEKGETPEAAKAAVSREFSGATLRLDLGEVEIAALRTYLGGGPEAKRLFCAE